MSDPKSLQPIPSHAKKVFSGVIFSIWQWEQKMFDGSVQTFEKAKRATSVGVLPVTEDKKIVMTSQRQPNMKPFISLVGGIVDPGESPQDAAHRELLEEVGMQCDELELWYSVQPVTKVEWPIYLYIARGSKVVSNPSPDSGEQIDTQAIEWGEFLEVITREDFRDKEVALRILQIMQDKQRLEELKRFILLGR